MIIQADVYIADDVLKDYLLSIKENRSDKTKKSGELFYQLSPYIKMKVKYFLNKYHLAYQEADAVENIVREHIYTVIKKFQIPPQNIWQKFYKEMDTQLNYRIILDLIQFGTSVFTDVKMSEGTLKNIFKLRKIIDRLTIEKKRTPTISEISKESGLSEKVVSKFVEDLHIFGDKYVPAEMAWHPKEIDNEIESELLQKEKSKVVHDAISRAIDKVKLSSDKFRTDPEAGKFISTNFDKIMKNLVESGGSVQETLSPWHMRSQTDSSIYHKVDYLWKQLKKYMREDKTLVNYITARRHIMQKLASTDNFIMNILNSL